MASITFKGTPIHTCGDLPPAGGPAPDVTLCNADLEDVSLSSFRGSPLVLNIVPSLDTSVCQASARSFNEKAEASGATIANVSCDLPFAMGRFCGGEGLDHLVNLSAFRAPEFGVEYGVRIEDGPLKGLLSRAVVVLNADGVVVHTEQVPEIAQEPDYEAALAALV